MRKILYRTKVLYIIYSKQKQVLSKTSVFPVHRASQLAVAVGD